MSCTMFMPEVTRPKTLEARYNNKFQKTEPSKGDESVEKMDERVLVVQVRRWDSGDEELHDSQEISKRRGGHAVRATDLRSVRLRTGVGH